MGVLFVLRNDSCVIFPFFADFGEVQGAEQPVVGHKSHHLKLAIDRNLSQLKALFDFDRD